MQILKGDILKSVTVQHIMKDTNSYCCVYYEQELPIEESCFVNSKNATVAQLIDYLKYEYIDIKTDCETKDYFIIYTNNTQDEIKELIDWLNDNSCGINARCILVTCKLDRKW